MLFVCLLAVVCCLLLADWLLLCVCWMWIAVRWLLLVAGCFSLLVVRCLSSGVCRLLFVCYVACSCLSAVCCFVLRDCCLQSIVCSSLSGVAVCSLLFVASLLLFAGCSDLFVVG